jgi:hypothetical protein
MKIYWICSSIFYEKGYLDDTFVTLLADHGAREVTFHFPTIPDNSRHVEIFYPMFYHLVPKKIKNNNQILSFKGIVLCLKVI